MKKWLIGASLVLLTLLLCSYLIIPGSFSIEEKVQAQVHPRSFQRTVLLQEQWTKWWPGAVKDTSAVPCFTYNGFTYTLSDSKLTTLAFSITDGDFSVDALLHCIPISADSIEFNWMAHKPLSPQPLKRWQSYFKSRQLDKDLKDVLNAMIAFYGNPDNIYGMHIQRSLVVDSTLFSTHAVSKGYPTPDFIYALVDQLKGYIAAQDAKVTGYPMLNVSTIDSLNFLTKVAVPVDRKLAPSGNMASRWMLGGGNILVTEAKGGPAAVQAAFHQLEQYISDYQRVAPAIPFESLVTDRRAVRDTGQWITRVYYPVM